MIESPNVAQRRSSVLAVLAGAFGSLDTALNIAFPNITDDLDLEVSDLQWVVTCFVLAYGLSLIAAGRIGDRRGHSATLALGAAMAAVGLAVCSAAPSLGVLLIGRVVQGFGTAFVMASAPPLIAHAAGLEARGKAVGLFQTAAGVGLALGPVIGGPLVDIGGWRGVFWFRLPLAALLLVLALPLLRAGRAATSVATDVASANGPQHSSEISWPRLVRNMNFVAANLLAIIVNGAMFATWLLVPALLVDHLETGVLLGGVVLAASPAATAAISPRAGSWSDGGHTGRLVVGGVFLAAAGMALLSAADAGWPAAGVAVGLAAVGLGLGLFSAPNMATVMAAVPDSEQGLGAGLSLTTRTIGIVLGVNVSSRMFDWWEAEHSFDQAFSVVFGTMAITLAVVGSLEMLRRVASQP